MYGLFLWKFLFALHVLRIHVCNFQKQMKTYKHFLSVSEWNTVMLLSAKLHKNLACWARLVLGRLIFILGVIWM